MRDFLVYVVGHWIARLTPLHRQTRNLRFKGFNFNVTFYCFSASGATISSFARSPQYDELCRAPRPDLCVVFMGGNDITENTVVANLQARLKEFCMHIEAITNSHIRVSMIEPRTRLLGVMRITFNKVRNSLNRNLQHRDQYFRPRSFITPLRFEYLSSNGVHPNAAGIERLILKVQKVACEYLHAHHANQA